MHNRNILLVGQPGAGKTQLAIRLAELAPRVVYFDPVLDYHTNGGVVVGSGAEAIDVLAERYREPFRLVVRAESGAEFAAVASMIERIQQEPGTEPVAVVFEEAGIYSGNTWTMPEPIERLYKLGRRWRVNCLAITQVDTDLNRTFRHTTHLWVACRSLKLTGDLQRHFDHDSVAELETIFPATRPVEGVHYLVSPAGRDLFREWSQAVNP